MLRVDVDSTKFVEGSEGTLIRQIFHPHNTMLGIGYSMAHCTLKPGSKSIPHRMKSSEVYYFTSGIGIMHVDEEVIEVKPNQSVYVPPHSRQFVENLSNLPLEFLCIVDPAWRKEDEIFD